MKIIAAYSSSSPQNQSGLNTLVWPDSAVVKSGKPIFLPEDEKMDISFGIGAKIHSVGKSIKEKFSYRYFDEIMPMVFFFKQNIAADISYGHTPSECDFVRDYSVIFGDCISVEYFKESNNKNLNVTFSPLNSRLSTSNKESATVELDNILDDLYASVSFTSINNTLKTGDIVAYLFRDILPVFPETLIKAEFNGKNLIENKLK